MHLLRSMAFILLMVVLAGCAFRPAESVLQPVQLSGHAGHLVRVLAVTNRSASATGGYGPSRANDMSYELFTISVPQQRNGAQIRYSNDSVDPSHDYVVLERERLTEATFLLEAQRGLPEDGTAALFVHGYNQSFQEALFRLAQVTADAGVSSSAILFSWPSEASLTGYMADRDASLASRSELARTVELLASQPRIRQVALGGHSMGGFLVMEALRQLKLQNQNRTLKKVGVILAAPDIDVELFRSQLETIGPLSLPLIVMVSPNDRALAVSSLLGSDRPRLGMLDINDPRVQLATADFGVTLIDISSVRSQDALGHDGFASMANFAERVALLAGQRRDNIAETGLFIFDAARAVLTAPLQ